MLVQQSSWLQSLLGGNLAFLVHNLVYDCFSGVGLLFSCRTRQLSNAEHDLCASIKVRKCPSSGAVVVYLTSLNHRIRGIRSVAAKRHRQLDTSFFLIDAALFLMSVLTPKRISLELLSVEEVSGGNENGQVRPSYHSPLIYCHLRGIISSRT